MDAVLEENPVDPELLWRLGKIVTLWASVESWIAMLLGTLMNADLGASSYLTNNTSNALQIKCIRALLSVHAHKEPATKDVVEWGIYPAVPNAIRLGEVEAADEREAIEKAAKEFQQNPAMLIVVRRPR
jgi:hypothetical protein